MKGPSMLEKRFRILLFVSAAMLALSLGLVGSPGAQTSGAAQARQPVPFMAAASRDSLYIVFLRWPRDASGLELLRQERDGRFVLLTAEPLRPVRDPSVFREAVGHDYEWVANVVNAEDETQTLRRLLRDPGTSAAVSLVSTRVASALGRLYVDTKLERDRSYNYRVRYISARGIPIDSVTYSARVVEVKPSPPSGLKADVEKGKKVRLTWEFPEYAGRPEDVVVGFNIYRGEGSEKPLRLNTVPLLRQSAKLERVDLSVEEGETYSYYVTSVNIIGKESVPSARFSIAMPDLTPPLPPDGLQLIADEGKITVSWKMNLEPDVASYDIFRATEISGDYKKLNAKPIPPDQPFFVDVGLVSGKQYFYKVSAIDKRGNESLRSTAASGLVKDTTPPSAPSSVAVAVVDGRATLTWLPSPSNDVAGYYVYRGEYPARMRRLSEKTVSGTTFRDEGFKDRGLTPGKTYYYGVSGVDFAFNESTQDTVRVTVPDEEAPFAPSVVTATLTLDGRVSLRWQPSVSMDVAGYKVYRAGAAGRQTAGEAVIATLGPKSFTFVDTTAEKGASHSYRVVAFDLRGNESKAEKPIAIIALDALPPPVPTGVKAVLVAQGVRVEWDRVRAPDLAGYNVYRSKYSSGKFEKLNSEPVKETTFLDKEGGAGLYYRVASLDSSGNESGKTLEVTK
jgi:fibronectin type 3 domain-containing protein